MAAEIPEDPSSLAAKIVSDAEAGYEKIFGSFADSEGFDEAVQLGQEYREAQNVLLMKETA